MHLKFYMLKIQIDLGTDLGVYFRSNRRKNDYESSVMSHHFYGCVKPHEAGTYLKFYFGH